MFPKLIDLSFELIDRPIGTNKHFSYILLRNTVISIGFNNYKKTHPRAMREGYKWGFVHSELDAIIKCPLTSSEMYRTKLINIRVNRKGEIHQSKPCSICNRLIAAFNFREVWYSTQMGFEKL